MNKSAKDDVIESFMKKKSLIDQLIETKISNENLQNLVLIFFLKTLVIR